jgi:hypothetical protein
MTQIILLVVNFILKSRIIHKSLTQQKSTYIHISKKYVQLGISCAQVGTQTARSSIKIDPHDEPWYKSPILRFNLLPITFTDENSHTPRNQRIPRPALVFIPVICHFFQHGTPFQTQDCVVDSLQEFMAREVA